MSDRCQELVDEFYVRQSLVKRGAAVTLTPTGDVKLFSRSIRRYAQQRLLQTIATSAAVNQAGSPASSGGSTNLTAKPTTTDLMSIASESGAFTDTLNGSSLTVQVNANGLLKYVSNKPVFTVEGRSWPDALQALTFTVGLNVAQSSGSATATSGSATSMPLPITSVLLPANNATFSSFQANYMFYRPYRPSSASAGKLVQSTVEAVTNFEPQMKDAGSAVAKAINTLQPMITNSQPIKDAERQWIKDGKVAEQKIDTAHFDDFVKAYSKYYEAYVGALSATSGFAQSALALDVAVQAYSSSVYSVMNAVRGKPLATVTYTYATPAQKPPTHEGTLVGSYLFKGGHKNDGIRTFMTGAQFTGNFTASVYSSLPAGAAYGRFRDVQLSSEFDKPVGGTSVEPRAVLSLAGYGQYQYDPTVLKITQGNLAPGTNISLPSDAQALLGTAGWLGVVQGKVVLSLRPGLSLPIAIKWSNKTDLLQANDVRGQIGLSYDLSALAKLISPQ